MYSLYQFFPLTGTYGNDFEPIKFFIPLSDKDYVIKRIHYHVFMICTIVYDSDTYVIVIKLNGKDFTDFLVGLMVR